VLIGTGTSVSTSFAKSRSGESNGYDNRRDDRMRVPRVRKTGRLFWPSAIVSTVDRSLARIRRGVMVNGRRRMPSSRSGCQIGSRRPSWPVHQHGARRLHGTFHGRTFSVPVCLVRTSSRKTTLILGGVATADTTGSKAKTTNQQGDTRFIETSRGIGVSRQFIILLPGAREIGKHDLSGLFGGVRILVRLAVRACFCAGFHVS